MFSTGTLGNGLSGGGLFGGGGLFNNNVDDLFLGGPVGNGADGAV